MRRAFAGGASTFDDAAKRAGRRGPGCCARCFSRAFLGAAWPSVSSR
ncbi:hypothetical protein [Lysobacter gummosus]